MIVCISKTRVHGIVLGHLEELVNPGAAVPPQVCKAPKCQSIIKYRKEKTMTDTITPADIPLAPAYQANFQQFYRQWISATVARQARPASLLNRRSVDLKHPQAIKPPCQLGSGPYNPSIMHELMQQRDTLGLSLKLMWLKLQGPSLPRL